VPDTTDHYNTQALLEPFTYITSNPGKEIRGTMIAAFNRWLNVPEDKLKTIARVVNMLHSASLLVDDIEDDSSLRRGHPVAHKIYGIPQTINTANYVYFLAYQELFSLRRENSAEATPNRLFSDVNLDKLVTGKSPGYQNHFTFVFASADCGIFARPYIS